MKKSILFISLLLASVALYSQPKKAKEIIITTELNQADNFQMVGATLSAAGISIENAIKDFGQVKTVEIKEGNFNTIVYYLEFTAVDGKIVLKGKFKMPYYDIYQDIENAGMGGSPNKKAFKKMLEVAELFKTDLAYN